VPFVIFVAQLLNENSSRFIEAAGSLPGVRLALVGQDAPEQLSGQARVRVVEYSRVENVYDTAQIIEAARALSGRHGAAHRIISSAEMMQLPLAEARGRLGVAGMGVEAARNFRDKARMKSVLREAGVPCARHRLVTREAEAWAFIEEVGYPVIVKPPEGVGAAATFRVERAEQLGAGLREASQVARGPVLVEEFLTGQEHSFDAVTIGGRGVWHSLTRYYPNPLEVVNNPFLQWCVVLPREIDDAKYDDVRDAGYRALEALGMDDGVSHTEWFRRADGSVAVSEVGARPPGAQFTTLISAAHDFDFHAAWARAVVFGEFEPPERRYAAGIAFLRGQGAGGRVRKVSGLAEVEREIGALVVKSKIPDAGQARASGYEGEGYVIVRHEETEVVERALHRIVSSVRVELE
jgi:phosphoribosylaminoimidazole carboxylase (NCAIR synthetase)